MKMSTSYKKVLESTSTAQAVQSSNLSHEKK